ncbi:MAG: 50S ribosomal protein L23 [Fusobacteriota bacterium]
MKNLYDVIKKPVVTEKSELLRMNENKYTFEVDKKANKYDVKTAVEKAFDVSVDKVNTMRTKSKVKRHGATLYRTAEVKKAIVKLKDGEEITYYENV